MADSLGPRISAPDHLSQEAREAWEALRRGSEDADGLLRLEFAAVQLVRARDAQRLLDAQGVVVPGGPKGDTSIVHPAVAVERAAQEQVRKWIEARSPEVKEPARDDDVGSTGWVARLVPSPVRNTA